MKLVVNAEKRFSITVFAREPNCLSHESWVMLTFIHTARNLKNQGQFSESKLPTFFYCWGLFFA